jgi:hypothetical protein
MRPLSSATAKVIPGKIMLSLITVQTEVCHSKEKYKMETFEKGKRYRENIPVFQVCPFIECNKAEQ